MDLSAAVSRAVYWLFPGVRSALLENAARILGPESAPAERGRLARSVLSSFARFLADMVSPPGALPVENLFQETEGRDHFAAAASRGRGIIAATLHMGNYEVPGMELAALGRSVAVVYNRERVRFLERIRSRRRREKKLDEIVIDGSPFFAIDALARLRDGGIILLAGDQVDSREGERFAFLHGHATFSLWPARLSIASGAPILPAFNLRGADGRYRLRLEAPILPEGGRDARALTEDLVRVFEGYVARHPEQWLMVRSFWEREPTPR